MSLPPIEPYVETFFWLTTAWQKAVPSGFVREDDIKVWLTQQMLVATDRFGSVVSRPYPHLAKNIFDRMLETGTLAVQSNDVAGSYFCLETGPLAAFRNSCLAGNAIADQHGAIGARLFDDVFSVYAGDGEATVADNFEHFEDAAPASDRLVSFDHNKPEYEDIANGLRDIKEAVRTTDDLPATAEEREQIVNALGAAELLWQSAQLNYMQVKIGILMAAEDAARVLATTTKAAAAGLLVEAIEALFKAYTGIDLDHL